MVKQKKRTRITQSGKNYAIKRFGCSSVSCSFATFLSIKLISSFCTQFQLFAFNFNFLHCLGLIDMLSANQRGEISACILLILKAHKAHS